ncbi:hypothetical protein RFI_14479 [Reticulomyxa filosa]|uniref:Transmembrane protein n=1 Tax=Reticulomyxa filosa TaxID=46433 RepID=X6N9H3_RETFI|nr:hypothetical protein RFI_14479 [Reticulomyxa filosa]|eukprot:ETO22706.1 hypothetical protein RFI_14479 [Reticulomyxa filosa]
MLVNKLLYIWRNNENIDNNTCMCFGINFNQHNHIQSIDENITLKSYVKIYMLSLMLKSTLLLLTSTDQCKNNALNTKLNTFNNNTKRKIKSLIYNINYQEKLLVNNQMKHLFKNSQKVQSQLMQIVFKQMQKILKTKKNCKHINQSLLYQRPDLVCFYFFPFLCLTLVVILVYFDMIFSFPLGKTNYQLIFFCALKKIKKCKKIKIKKKYFVLGAACIKNFLFRFFILFSIFKFFYLVNFLNYEIML